MEIKLSACFITVSDQDKALAFYRDVLGLQVKNDVTMEGMRWVTVTPPSQPEIEIGLFKPEYNPGLSADDRDAVNRLLAKGALDGVNFDTDNVDALFEKVRASGAEVLQEPIDQHYGVRDCAFRDPSGNMVRFSSHKS